MAKIFKIPNLGEGIEEATIVQWLVEDGVKVEAGQDVLELETDKATVPVPVDSTGYLHQGPYGPDDVVSVNTVVATIGAEGEAFDPDSAGEAEDQPPEAEAAPAGVEETQAESAGRPGEPVANGRPKATPVAQKMAADLGVELEKIPGSGEQGKITKLDVRQAVEEPAERAEAAKPEPEPEKKSPEKPSPPAKPAAEGPPAEDVLKTVPLKGVRGVIARRMAESVQTTARVTLTTEVDATEFVALREQLKAKHSEDWGFSPGYNDLLALIVTSALRQFPYMNARLSADGEAIEQLEPINLGMAVDTDRGLMVPVISDADTKGLREFGQSFRDLVNRAREGKSSLEDLSGGTFTITNLGMYRVDAFTPVINLPEVAILGVGRIQPKPVARDGEIVIRQMMVLSLVLDHRLVDGAPAARFLDYICEIIEEPSLLFLTRR